ncbi:epoxyqueuosine reductase QueH [bacterium]|nr:epoxyqueuosine reductase QueH [bacterium]
MVQNTDNRILIPACCGICSGYPIGLLKEMGYSPVVYFYNPNIDTHEEFNRRLEAQKIVCMYHWVDLVAEDYNHEEYLNYVKGYETEPERGARCDKCIELRLIKTAKKAKELGINKFTTSLVISPHKNYDKISAIGKQAAESILNKTESKKELQSEEPSIGLSPLDLPPSNLPPSNLPLEYLPLDFKKKDGFLKTNKLSKELGLYRQNYCGCEFVKK